MGTGRRTEDSLPWVLVGLSVRWRPVVHEDEYPDDEDEEGGQHQPAGLVTREFLIQSSSLS